MSNDHTSTGQLGHRGLPQKNDVWLKSISQSGLSLSCPARASTASTSVSPVAVYSVAVIVRSL